MQVHKKDSFYIGDTRGYNKYINGGLFKRVKTKTTVSHVDLAHMLSGDDMKIDDNLTGYDPENQFDQFLSFICFKSLYKYQELHKRVPHAWNLSDIDQFERLAIEEMKARKVPNLIDLTKQEAKDKVSALFRLFGATCSGCFPPIAAFFGGFASQEIIKALTQKFIPLNQLFCLNVKELFLTETNILANLNATIQNNLAKFYSPSKVQSGLANCLDGELIEKLREASVFVVGSGAIGCELLKNYAMLGIGEKNQIYITDPDIIELSNLNRQFLFQEKHLRKPKSVVAAAVCMQMNPNLKDRITALIQKVEPKTENIFSDNFLQEKVDVVTNALDNVAARRYVDSRCVRSRKPMLESGTLGARGHVQVVIPMETETYGSQQDPEDAKEIPMCTLKMFPEEPIHCVEWAKNKFQELFFDKPNAIHRVLEGITRGDLETVDGTILRKASRGLAKVPKNLDDCIMRAREKYEKFFVRDIRKLMAAYPIDKVTKEGVKFWTLPRRPPTEQPFDILNSLHVMFVTSYAYVLARAYNIAPPINYRSMDVRRKVIAPAANYVPKAFVIDKKKIEELEKEVEKEDKKKKESKKSEMEIEAAPQQQPQSLFVDYPKEITKTLEKIGKLKDKKLTIEKPSDLCQAIEFEKDVDENCHIDLLHAMTNLRSQNYKIDEMEWINVKLKSGNIIPALSTTTSVIAALQTIELCKLIKKCSPAQHKNAFLNLAVPSLALSEPAAAKKYKINKYVEFTLWDRWDINVVENGIKSFSDILHHLARRTQLIPQDVFYGSQAIYMYKIMNTSAKKKDNEIVLKKDLRELLDIDVINKHFSNQFLKSLISFVGFDKARGLIRHIWNGRLGGRL